MGAGTRIIKVSQECALNIRNTLRSLRFEAGLDNRKEKKKNSSLPWIGHGLLICGETRQDGIIMLI